MDFPAGRTPTCPTDTLPASLEDEILSGPIPVASVLVPQEATASQQIRVEMAALIKSRLESRLPGRIRRLRVEATEDAIVLDGQCSTYYTKQLAQHVAMAVLEYEQLVNNIDVSTLQ